MTAADTGAELELELRAIARRSFIESCSSRFGLVLFEEVWEPAVRRMAKHGISEDDLYYDLEDEAFDQFAGTLRAALTRCYDRHTAADATAKYWTGTQ